MQFGWPTYCDNISRSVLIYVRKPWSALTFRSDATGTFFRSSGLAAYSRSKKCQHPRNDRSTFDVSWHRRDTPSWEIFRNGTVHTIVETAFVDCGKILQGGIHIIHKLLWITQNYVKEWYLHNFFHIMLISPWINRPDSSTDTLKTLYLLGFRVVKKGKTVYCQTCQTIL